MLNTSWFDNKYINLLSNSLRNFKRKDQTLYNFSCPLCGDSQTNKNKARAFLFMKSGKYFFFCHNCNQSLTFKRFLEQINGSLYNDYVTEMFTENNEKPIDKPIKQDFSILKKQIKLPKVSQLISTHPLKQYIVKRQIPTPYHCQLYYATSFKKWVNTLKPNKFENENNDSPRLVIPLFDEQGKLFGFQGRAIDNIEPRYITIILDDTDERQPKIYGLNTVDYNKTYYIFEGAIDSMFIPNSIACLGSSLTTEMGRLNKPKDNAVLVFDNEPRNKFIVQTMLTAAKSGFKVVVWPQSCTHKDINQMILQKVSGDYCKTELVQKAGKCIQTLIDKQTFQGLALELEINMWKKI